MGKKVSPRPTRTEATLEKIAAATLQLMIDKGADNISVTEICRVAGVSRPTLYRHFPTQEAVIESVYLRIRDEFDQQLQAAIDQNPATEHRLDVIVTHLAHQILDRRYQRQFKTNPYFSLEVVNRSFDSRTALYESMLAPLFDQAEEISGHRIDRHGAAQMLNHLYVALNLRAVWAPPEQVEQTLRQYIQTVLQTPLRRD